MNMKTHRVEESLTFSKNFINQHGLMIDFILLNLKRQDFVFFYHLPLIACLF